MRTSIIFNDRGASNFKVLFWILVLVSVGYGVYMFVPSYVSYMMFKTDVQEEAKMAHMYTDAKLIERMVTKANGWNVPVDATDFKILRSHNEIRIVVGYSVRLNFPANYSRTLYFDIDVTKPLREGTGALN